MKHTMRFVRKKSCSISLTQYITSFKQLLFQLKINKHEGKKKVNTNHIYVELAPNTLMHMHVNINAPKKSTSNYSLHPHTH